MSSLRERLRDVSPYLVLLVAIATLGPLQFGYHLVNSARPVAAQRRVANMRLYRPSSMPPRMPSRAAPRALIAAPSTRHGSRAAYP